MGSLGTLQASPFLYQASLYSLLCSNCYWYSVFSSNSELSADFLITVFISTWFSCIIQFLRYFVPLLKFWPLFGESTMQSAMIVRRSQPLFLRFLVSYVPGGTTGLTFMAKLASRLCTSTLSSAIDA